MFMLIIDKFNLDLNFLDNFSSILFVLYREALVV